MALPAPANYDPNLLDDFMVEFEEAHEFSENVLVELEKYPADEELLHKLFRSVHTIKGNLTFIGFQILVPLLQSVEDILSAVRNEEFCFTREISDVVLLSLDRTKELIDELSGGDDSGTTESSLDHLSRLIASVATCDDKSREARLHSIILELDPSTLALSDPSKNQDTNQEDIHPELVHLDTSLGKIEKLLLAHQVTIDDDIAFFFSLMKPLEARSTYWSGRSFRLLLIALSMNHKAGNPINATQLTTAVIMHDISMAFLPLDILHKSTVYNADERKIVQNHAISSHQLLKNMNRWAEAAEMVLQHHEHFDGMGYPEGLSDEHICHGAKVLAIIDAYDAITHERAHTSRVKRPFIRAVLEINSLSGSQFSPYWIEIFNSVIKMLHARGLV